MKRRRARDALRCDSTRAVMAEKVVIATLLNPTGCLWSHAVIAAVRKPEWVFGVISAS